MVVSADGTTMTSMGSIALGASQATPAAGGPAPALSPDVDDPTTTDCVIVAPNLGDGTPTNQCAGCELTGDGAAPPPNDQPNASAMTTGGAGGGRGPSGAAGSSGGSGSSGGPSGAGPILSSAGGGGGVFVGSGIMESDAGLVTSAYFLDHQLVTYQSQGQDIGIDLQYSSGQAEAEPVVQYQFTTPLGGDSSSITSISAQVSIGGVVQGAATTYNTPDGLSDGETYDIPLQVNATSLPTGVYPYTMTVTENFGSSADEASVTSLSGSGGTSGDGGTSGGGGAGCVTSLTSTNEGSVNVVNEASDPLGAGWSVGGLQKLSQLATDGPVLITAGQQGTEAFEPAYSEGQSSIQDLALATTTSAVKIMPNDGAGDFSATVSATDTVVGTASGVFTSNGESDMAVVSSSTLAIELNNGSGGFTAGSSYTIPSGYEAKGIVAGNFTGHTGSTLDLAVLLASTSTDAYAVAVYTGSGGGTFATPVVSAAGNGVSSGAQPDSIVAADFNGGTDTDIAFTTDNGLLDEMIPTSSGSMSAATSLTLPSGHLAIGVTTLDYNSNGDIDLAVEVNNTNVEEGSIPFVSLDLLTGNGTGGFSDTSTYQTVTVADYDTLGLVAGDFQGPSIGLEVAVPLSNGTGGTNSYLDVVPLSTSGTWGNGVIHNIDTYADPSFGTSTQAGNIVAADFNGAGYTGIALANSGTGQIEILMADIGSNQFLPVETIDASSSSSAIGMLAAAPFMEHAAAVTYNGPTSDPSALLHNSNGTWTRTYPDGTVIQFNSSGQETSESDVDGNTFTYTYVTSGAAAGALAKMTDPVGLATTLTYNSSGYISTITDPADRVTTFTVGTDGNLTEIEDPDDAITQYGYSTPANHEATTETDPNNQTATAHYNSFGQLTSETLFGGSATTSIDPALSNGLLAPGGSGSLSTDYEGSVTDPDGHTTTVSYKGIIHPTGEVQSNGGTTTATNNSQGFPVTETNAAVDLISYTYDSSGDVTSIKEPFVADPAINYSSGGSRGSGGSGGSGIHPANLTETITYDQFGVPTSITDFNGNTTTFVLDSHGNVLEEEQPGGLDEEWTYNSAGQMLTYTDGDGAVTSYVYNSLGRLTEIEEPGSGSPTIEYGYDTAGDVSSITDEVGDTVTYTYNKMGQVLTEQNPVQAAAGKDGAFAYDEDGNLLTETDADGLTTSYTYNARDEELSMTDAMHSTTSFGYDATGNLISITDSMDNTTTYSYTSENELLTVTDPLHQTVTNGYNLDGEETSVTDGNGQTTLFNYDALGQVESEVIPNVSPPSGGSGGSAGEPPASYTYGYDYDGDLVASTDPNGHTVSDSYNALNEETSVKNADCDTTDVTYDGDGNVLTETDGLGHTTSYTYNDMNQVLTEKQPSGGGTTSYR
jgi:YD repeat-containing protein